MRKILFFILVLGLVFIPVLIFAEEQLLPIREGSKPEASQHIPKAQRNYEETFKHFRNVLKIAPSAESYFNGTLSLHKWGYPKEAANFFYYAKKIRQRQCKYPSVRSGKPVSCATQT